MNVTANRARPANATNASTTATTTQVRPEADASLQTLSANSDHEPAAVFEARSTARTTSQPQPQPPPQPRLISDAKVTDPDVKAAIREKNDARIAAYNDAYQGYVDRMAQAVKSAPSLERVAGLGVPASYDPLSSLPVNQRGRYTEQLASPGLQNAEAFHHARGARMFAAEGIATPGQLKVEGGIEVKLAGMNAEVSGSSGTEGVPTEFGFKKAGGSLDSAAVKSTLDRMNDRKASKHESGIILETSVGKDGDVSTTLGGKVLDFGATATVDANGDVQKVAVFTPNLELAVGTDGMHGKIKAGGETSVAGYDVELEGAVTFGTTGDNMQLGLEGATGIEGVAEIGASLDVEVGLLSQKAAQRALMGNGFEAMMAQRAGGR